MNQAKGFLFNILSMKIRKVSLGLGGLNRLPLQPAAALCLLARVRCNKRANCTRRSDRDCSSRICDMLDHSPMGPPPVGEIKKGLCNLVWVAL